MFLPIEMSPLIEIICVVWTLLSVSWFLCAAALVFMNPRKIRPFPSENLPSVTIFKPLPPLEEDGIAQELILGLESFIRQMDAGTEILLGVDDTDFPFWEKIIDQWRQRFPAARLLVIRQPKPDLFPNPKIAWQILLARHATGKLWLWSDADIRVPDFFLNAIRSEIVESGCRITTCPYTIQAVPNACTLLDTLFVNVEFYPGVLLMRRRKVRFALGAATLFYAEDFRQKADWGKLGSTLADDNELGRQLGPVTISRHVVETLPRENNFRGAFLHYLRWHKTVRWCEPAGYAGQLVVLPLLGWIFSLALDPLNPVAWIGLTATSLCEAAIAALILLRVQCSIPLGWRWMILAWTAIRPAAWLLSWAPGSVRWSGCGHRWFGLRKLELFERS